MRTMIVPSFPFLQVSPQLKVQVHSNQRSSSTMNPVPAPLSKEYTSQSFLNCPKGRWNPNEIADICFGATPLISFSPQPTRRNMNDRGAFRRHIPQRLTLLSSQRLKNHRDLRTDSLFTNCHLLFDRASPQVHQSLSKSTTTLSQKHTGQWKQHRAKRHRILQSGNTNQTDRCLRIVGLSRVML